jgi:hypothetical protein
MSNKYHKYKDVLTSFLQEHGYLVYGKSLPKKITYLYAKDQQFPIIKIAVVKKQPDNSVDHEIEYLKSEIAEQRNTSPQVISSLEIYLSDKFENNTVNHDNDLVLISNSWEYLVEQLTSVYPQIANLDNPDEVVQDNKLGENDFSLEEIKSTDDLRKKLGLLNLQLKNGNSIGTMIIAGLFLIVPVILAIASIVVLGGFANANSRGINSLLFGGTSFSLTILGGQ